MTKSSRASAIRRKYTDFIRKVVLPGRVVLPESFRIGTCDDSFIGAYFLLARSAKSFLTAFCSSNRNALTIRIFTQLAHVAPPYARETVLSRFLVFLYADLLRCLIPGRLVLQSEHRGPLVVFLIFCAAYLPPGVRIVRMRADLVLYECLPARVTRLSAMLFESDLN